MRPDARLATATLLFLAGIGGLAAGVLVQTWPAFAPWFVPPGAPHDLVRTFLVTDLVLLGALPLYAARGLLRGTGVGYAAACAFAGAAAFAATWTWTAVATAGLPWFGAALCTPAPLLAAWGLVVLRPGGPAEPVVRAAARTTAPERLVVLYDGHCGLCRGAVERLRSWAGDTAFEALSLHDPDVATRFPGLPRAALLRALHTVDGAGRVREGVEAVLTCAAARPGFGWLPAVYRLPGIAVTVDLGYAWIAKNRLALSGAACRDGVCAVHPARPDSNQRTAKSTSSR